MKKKVVIDPDFGPIEVPPPPTRAEFEKAGREALAAVLGRRQWPTGSVGPCPSCKRKTFIGRDDLEHRVVRPGGVIIFRHLRGAKCQSCGAQSLEMEDMIDVEDESGAGVVGDYKARVCIIGSGSWGTYWPRDVVRNLDLERKTHAFIKILDADTVVVNFRRIPEGIYARDPGRRRSRRRRTATRAKGKRTGQG
jgi:hypothetical protein